MPRKSSSSDLLSPQRSHRVQEKCSATNVAFSADGSQVAIAYRSFGKREFANKVLVWNLATWRRRKTLRGCTDSVDGLAFSPDGALLACAGSTKDRFMGGEVNLWCTRTWKKTLSINHEDVESLRRVAWSTDGSMLVTGSACCSTSRADKKARFWNTTNGEPIQEFAPFRSDVHALQFSPDGKAVAIGVPGERTASVWSAPGGRKRWLKRAHAEASSIAVGFSPDGSLLATCGDRNVALWDARNGKSVAVLKGHAGPVEAVAFSPDSKTLVSTSWCEFCMWDVPNGRLLGQQALPKTNLIAVRVSPDGDACYGVHTINDELTITQFALHRPASAPHSIAVAAHTPSSEEAKQIAAVIADPDNDSKRRRYADWLDKRKDPRGEFIRLQLELAAFGPTHSLSTQQKRRRTQLAKKCDKMVRTHFAEWTAPLADLELSPWQVKYRRGFLWSLELREIDVTNESLKTLRHAPELERLDLDGSGVTNAGMKHLAAVTNLREITVSETSVTPAAFAHLTTLKRLVRLYNYEWGNKPIAAVEAWKQRRNRRFLRLPADERRREAEAALPFIVDWFPAEASGKFKTISYSQSWASDADLVYLRAFPEVEKLDFFECRAVTSEGLKHLRSLTNLRTLRLRKRASPT